MKFVKAEIKKYFLFAFCITFALFCSREVNANTSNGIGVLGLENSQISDDFFCDFSIARNFSRKNIDFEISNDGNYLLTFDNSNDRFTKEDKLTYIISNNTNDKTYIIYNLETFGFDQYNTELLGFSNAYKSLILFDIKELFNNGLFKNSKASSSSDKHFDLIRDWIIVGGKYGYIIYLNYKKRSFGIMDTNSNILYLNNLQNDEIFDQFTFFPSNINGFKWVPSILTKKIVNNEAVGYKSWSFYSKDHISKHNIYGKEVSLIGEYNNSVYYLSRGTGYRTVITSENDNTKILFKKNIDFYDGDLLPNGDIILNDFNGQLYKFINKSNSLQEITNLRSKYLGYSPKNGELVASIDNNNILKINQLNNNDNFQHFQNKCSNMVSVKGEKVYLKEKNNIIHGYYFKANNIKNLSKKFILYFHGGPYSNISEWGNSSISEYINNGFNVLAINYPFSPGYGDKYINGNIMSIEQTYDISKKMLIEIAKKQSSENFDIYLVGTSYGTTFVNYAISKNDTNISGAYISKPACKFKYYFDESDGSSFYTLNKFEKLSFNLKKITIKKNDQKYKELNLCDLKKSTIPTRIVVGINDKNANPKDGYLMKQTSINSELLVLNEDHNSTAKSMKEQIAKTINFWEKNKNTR